MTVISQVKDTRARSRWTVELVDQGDTVLWQVRGVRGGVRQRLTLDRAQLNHVRQMIVALQDPRASASREAVCGTHDFEVRCGRFAQWWLWFEPRRAKCAGVTVDGAGESWRAVLRMIDQGIAQLSANGRLNA